jgi:hypothetical protein
VAYLFEQHPILHGEVELQVYWSFANSTFSKESAWENATFKMRTMGIIIFDNMAPCILGSRLGNDASTRIPNIYSAGLPIFNQFLSNY